MMCVMSSLIFALQECILHKLPESLVHCHRLFYQLTPSSIQSLTPLTHYVPQPSSILPKLHTPSHPSHPIPPLTHTIPHSHTHYPTLPHTIPHYHASPSHTQPPAPHTRTHNPLLHRHAHTTPCSTDMHTQPTAPQTCTHNPLLHRHAHTTHCSTDMHTQPPAVQTCTHNPLLHRHAHTTHFCTDMHTQPTAAQTCTHNPLLYRHAHTTLCCTFFSALDRMFSLSLLQANGSTPVHLGPATRKAQQSLLTFQHGHCDHRVCLRRAEAHQHHTQDSLPAVRATHRLSWSHPPPCCLAAPAPSCASPSLLQKAQRAMCACTSQPTPPLTRHTQSCQYSLWSNMTNSSKSLDEKRRENVLNLPRRSL